MGFMYIAKLSCLKRKLSAYANRLATHRTVVSGKLWVE
jgi:hypothetical protein